MPDLDRRVRELVAQLRDTLEALHQVDCGEASPQALRPPATEAALAALAGALGGTVPPSYAAFLRLHDGWERYSGEAQLLGAGARGEPWVGARLREVRALLAARDEGEVLEDALAIVLGPTEPSFVVFDLAHRDARGELRVVHWDLEEGDLGTFDSFLEFLEDELETARAALEEAAAEAEAGGGDDDSDDD